MSKIREYDEGSNFHIPQPQVKNMEIEPIKPRPTQGMKEPVSRQPIHSESEETEREDDEEEEDEDDEMHTVQKKEIEMDDEESDIDMPEDDAFYKQRTQDLHQQK